MAGAEPFQNAEAARLFIQAGNARITVQSQLTDMRYTFWIEKNEEEGVEPERRSFFVRLLKGRDNTRDYTYIGMIRGTRFFVTKATRHMAEAAFVKGFEYIYKHLCAGRMPPHAEIWHEGACGRCGRPLTVPESIHRGIGPECWKWVNTND